jgi:hypothetical protein
VENEVFLALIHTVTASSQEFFHLALEGGEWLASSSSCIKLGEKTAAKIGCEAKWTLEKVSIWYLRESFFC